MNITPKWEPCEGSLRPSAPHLPPPHARSARPRQTLRPPTCRHPTLDSLGLPRWCAAGRAGGLPTRPETAKPPWLSTRAARIPKRGWLSLAIYVKRLKYFNREVRSHRLAPVCWEEKQPSESVPPFVACGRWLATPVPAQIGIPSRLVTVGIFEVFMLYMPQRSNPDGLLSLTLASGLSNLDAGFSQS